MAVNVPCILAPFRGAELAGGATAGTISVVVNAVRETLPFPAAGALTLQRCYYVAGDDLADAATLGGQGDLIKMLEDAINAHGQAPALVLTQDGAGRLSATSGAAVTVEGAHANTDVDLTVWGLDNDGDHVLGTAATDFPFRHRRGWYPGHHQSQDSREQAKLVGGIARPVNGMPWAVVLPVGPKQRELGWMAIDPHLMLEDLAAVDAPWSALQTTWEEAIAMGMPWRFYQDTDTRTSSSFRVYELGELPRDGVPWVENGENLYFYDVRLLGVRRTA